MTVYEFGVAIGGSAVPKRGGPANGLAKTPEFVWHTTIDAVDRDDGDDVSSDSTSDDAIDTTPASSNHSDQRRQQRARKRRVRWLKPLERVTMLEAAGCSEKRIYRMLMESSEIAMSRRLCISVQRSVAV